MSWSHFTLHIKEVEVLSFVFESGRIQPHTTIVAELLEIGNIIIGEDNIFEMWSKIVVFARQVVLRLFQPAEICGCYPTPHSSTAVFVPSTTWNAFKPSTELVKSSSRFVSFRHSVSLAASRRLTTILCPNLD